jgi:hypothetical protein
VFPWHCVHTSLTEADVRDFLKDHCFTYASAAHAAVVDNKPSIAAKSRKCSSPKEKPCKSSIITQPMVDLDKHLGTLLSSTVLTAHISPMPALLVSEEDAETGEPGTLLFRPPLYIVIYCQSLGDSFLCPLLCALHSFALHRATTCVRTVDKCISTTPSCVPRRVRRVTQP